MSITPYNPQGYVPGGSSVAKARAIMSLARRRRPIPRPRVTSGVAAPPVVDPFLNRANTVSEGLFSPLLKRLGETRALAETNARTAYGQHASALENALKASAAPISGAFDTAIGQSAKVNEAVANRLAGQGQTAGGDLAAKLAQISADPSGAAKLAADYAAASNAGFASGAADLGSLIGRRGEALSYQGKLPGIGRLAAAQALERALSEGRGYFGEQEADLNRSAVETAGQLYGQFRSESEARRQDAAEIRQRTLDRQQQEKASIRALAATAQSEAERRRYESQEAQLERQHDKELAMLDYEQALVTDNPPKPDKVTGPANQKWITVNGKKVRNPNYVPPKEGGKSAGDTWQTPGSAKRDRAVQAGARAVIGESGGFNQKILNRLKKFPNSPDAIINTAINQALRAQGVPPNHPSAKQIRDAIRQRLSGSKYKDKDGNEYEFVA